MKIFIKNTRLRNIRNDKNILLAKIYFDSSSLSRNNLLFDTIDYECAIEIINDVHWDDFMDNYLKEFRSNESINIIAYNNESIIISSEQHPKLVSLYEIDMHELCMGLQKIANDADLSYLERNFINHNYVITPNVDEENENLPDITEYISQHQDSFKVVYYPGSGDDFSSLQLFGRFANIEKIIFTDYFNAPEITKIRELIDERGENVVKIMPKHFNKRQWHQFWPSDRAAFSEEYIHPRYAWGRLLEFKPKNKSFQFYYLGTEAVKTVSILIENGIHPDVLVLQDHGFGGNWTVFGRENLHLYNSMINHLPEYILLDPKGNTDIWPGYKQVTKTYIPGILNANSAYTAKRALYKRVK